MEANGSQGAYAIYSLICVIGNDSQNFYERPFCFHIHSKGFLVFGERMDDCILLATKFVTSVTWHLRNKSELHDHILIDHITHYNITTI